MSLPRFFHEHLIDFDPGKFGNRPHLIGTGGTGRQRHDFREIDVYDPDLTLTGLRLIYEKNRRTKPAAESD